jgi:heterogeneous nuclear ribonucleoprotein A1/A3
MVYDRGRVVMVKHPLLGELEVIDGQDPDALIKRKMKTLKGAVIKQVNHYFSDANWEKDEHLRQLADDEGFVEISQLVLFDRLAQLSSDVKFVCSCLEESDTVEISACATLVRRRPRGGGAASCATPLRAEKKAKLAAESSLSDHALPLYREDVSQNCAASNLHIKSSEVSAPSKTACGSVGNGARSQQASTQFKVFVGGLPFACSEATLHKDFSECGRIAELTIIKDRDTGKSRGIAFISFEDEAGFLAALKYDGDDYGGRILKVSKSDGAGKGKGDGKGKGKRGKDGKDGKTGGRDGGKGKTESKDGKPDQVQATGPASETRYSVVVKSCAPEVTQEDLQQAFQACGQGPQQIRLLINKKTGESRGVAFLDFPDANAVDAALKLAGTEIKGRAITVDNAKSITK